MATISNAEFFRRLRQQRGTSSYSFNVDEFQGDDELSYSAYVDSVMNNRMLENEEERINKELIARSNELTQSVPNNRPETVDNVIANAQNETNAYTRTINTVNEVALDLVKGMWGFIEGLGDAVITGIGAVGSWFGADTEWADNAVAYDWASRAARATYNISPLALLSGDMFENNPNRWDFSDEGMEEFEQGLYTDSWLYEAPSVVHDTLNSVAEGIGQQIPTIALAVLTGGGSTGASLLSQAGTKLLSTSLMGASAVGSSSQALLQEDENRTVGDVALYALVSGAVEMGTEYMLEPLQYLGDMFPTSKVAQSISKAFPNFTAGVSTNASGSIVKNLFGTMVEEGIEEVASDLVDPAMRALFLDHTSIGESYKNNLKGEDLLNSFVVGALSAGVLGGGSVIVNTYRSGGINNYRAILGVQELQDLQARGQELINRGLAYQVNQQTGETELTPIAQNLVNRMTNVKERINRNVERMNETQKRKYLTSITNKSYAEIVQNAKNNVNQLETQYNQILQNIDELIIQTNNNLSLSPSERQVRINNLEKNKETARFLNENLVKRAREIVNNQEENEIQQAIKIVNQSYEETINSIKDAGETQEYSKYKNNLKKDLQKYARDLTVANQERIRKDLENINATLNTYLKSATTNEQRYKVFKSLIDFKQALNLMAYNKEILTNDFLNDYINDYIENTKNKTIKDALIEYQASKLFERINVNTRLVLMEENFFKVGEKGRYDATQNVIYLNKKYANEYSRTFAHEFVGHILFDTIGIRRRNKYVEQIMNSNWYQNVKENFERAYNFEGKNYSELTEEEKESYDSELFAKFLEDKATDDSFLTIISEPNFIKRAIITLRNKIRRVNVDNRFVNEVKRVIDDFNSKMTYLSRTGVKYSKKVEENTELDYTKTDDFRRLQERSKQLLKEFEHSRTTYQELDENLRKRYTRSIQQALESGRNSRAYDFRLLNSSKNSSFNITNNINPNLFHDAFETIKPYLKQNELVDLHDDYKNCKCFLSEDGLQGFAIEPNGNLISVFNADNNKRGFVEAISGYAKEQGANHLDCYGYLAKYYNKVLGFKVVSIMEYNMEYDHHNIAENYNSPEVAFMVNTNQNVETRHFNKEQYDEAKAYQLKIKENAKPIQNIEIEDEKAFGENLERGDIQNRFSFISNTSLSTSNLQQETNIDNINEWNNFVSTVFNNNDVNIELSNNTTELINELSNNLELLNPTEINSIKTHRKAKNGSVSTRYTFDNPNDNLRYKLNGNELNRLLKDIYISTEINDSSSIQDTIDILIDVNNTMIGKQLKVRNFSELSPNEFLNVYSNYIALTFGVKLSNGTSITLEEFLSNLYEQTLNLNIKNGIVHNLLNEISNFKDAFSKELSSLGFSNEIIDAFNTINNNEEVISNFNKLVKSKKKKISSKDKNIIKTRIDLFRKLNKVPDDTTVIINIDFDLFNSIFKFAKNIIPNGDLLVNQENAKYYLSSDGLSGFAINENKELVNFFNLNDDLDAFINFAKPIIEQEANHFEMFDTIEFNEIANKLGFTRYGNRYTPENYYNTQTKETIHTTIYLYKTSDYTNEDIIRDLDNKFNDSVDEKHIKLYKEIIRKPYFNNLATASMISLLTNKDIELLDLMTKRNLTNEEIASMPIYQFAEDYINNHEQLKPNEHSELVEQTKKEFKEIILAQANTRNSDNKHKKIMFVTGLPGAGKSSGVVRDFLNNDGAVEFDNDIAKNVPCLAKYYDYGLGANVVQKIVSIAQEQLLNELLEEGYNIVYPTIGKKYGKILEELTIYKNANYEISFIYVNVSNQTSKNRALKRFIEGGRFVPPLDYIDGIENKPELVYNQIGEDIKNGQSAIQFRRIERINNEPNNQSSISSSERTTNGSSDLNDARDAKEGRLEAVSRRTDVLSNEEQDQEPNRVREHYDTTSDDLVNPKEKIILTPFERDKARNIKIVTNQKLGKIISFKDTKDTYNKIIEWLRVNFNLELENQDEKARALFETYNLPINYTLKDFIDDIFRSNVEIQENKLSLERFLIENGHDVAQIKEDLTFVLESLLNEKAKDTETQKAINRLVARLDLAFNTIAELKAQGNLFKQILSKVNRIKNRIKLNNDTSYYGNLRLDEFGLLKYLVSGFITTKNGYISGSWRKKAHTLLSKGYLDILEKSVFNNLDEDTNTGDLDLTITFFRDLAKTYKANQKYQQRLSLEEATLLNGALSSIYNAMDKYQNRTYAKIEEDAIKDYSYSEIRLKNAYRNPIINKIRNFTDKLINPISVFSITFGGRSSSIYQNTIGRLVRAYDRFRLTQTNLLKEFENKFVSKKSEIVKNANKIVIFKGEKTYRYSLYALYLNLTTSENFKKVINGGYEINLTNKQVKRFDFDVDLGNEVAEKLTPNEKRDLDKLKEFLNTTMFDFLKEKQIEIDGFSTLLDAHDYYPIASSIAQRNATLGQMGDVPFLVDASSWGNLKMRTNSKQTIQMSNPISLINAYIESASRYGELTQDEKYVNRLFNKKMQGKKYSSLKHLYSSLVPNFNTHLNSFYNKLQGNRLDNVNYQRSIVGTLGSNVASAVLSYNISSAFKQIGSLPTANVLSGLKSGIKAFFNGNTYNLKRAYDYLIKNNGTFAYRVYDHGYINSQTFINEYAKLGGNIIKNIVKIGQLPMEKLDMLVILVSFGKAQQSIYDQYGYAIGSEQNLKLANEMLTDMILNTQSNADPIAKSMLRSGEMGEVSKIIFGIFASDSQNKLSLLLENAINWNTNRMLLRQLESESDRNESEIDRVKKELKNSRNKFNVSLVSVVESAVLTTLMALIAQLLLGKKDKDEVNVEDELMNLLLETFIDWVPFVSTISNTFQYGGELNAMPLQTLTDIITELSNCFSEDGADFSKVRIYKLLFSLSEALGLPLENVANLLYGAFYQFNPEIAFEYKTYLYQYSENYLYTIYKEDKEALSNNLALRELNTLLIRFKSGSASLDVRKEMMRLNYVPDSVPTDVPFDRNIYQYANIVADNVVKSGLYNSMTDSQKISTLRRIYDAYYDASLNEQETKLGMIASSGFDITNIVLYYIKLKDIIGERKETITRILNSSNLTLNEKLLIGRLMNYSVNESHEERLYQYFKNRGLTTSEAKYVVGIA